MLNTSCWPRLFLSGGSHLETCLLPSISYGSSLFLNQKRTTRRTTMLLPGGIGKRVGYTPQKLTKGNYDFVLEYGKDPSAYPKISPLKEEPWPRGKWTPESMRTGIICKKIGVLPQWDKEGNRFFTTLLQVADNHVINYIDPDTWQKTSRRGKKFGQGKYGCLVVGADSMNPQVFTAGYRGLFNTAGVMPKKRLHSFMITPDARIEPDTPLFASHFRPGQYVDCFGKSQGYGFQGVMRRWDFHGGPSDERGATKFHRRPGTIGAKGDAWVLPGRRLPGHMGCEWACARGLKIWRINTKYNVLYVHGPGVPGPTHHYVLLRDSIVEKKTVKDPAFPTHYPEEEKELLAEDLYATDIHRFTDPTILFPESDEKPRGPHVKVKKQAKAAKR